MDVDSLLVAAEAIALTPYKYELYDFGGGRLLVQTPTCMVGVTCRGHKRVTCVMVNYDSMTAESLIEALTRAREANRKQEDYFSIIP